MVSVERKDYWLEKIAWFVMENMNTDKPFNEAFNESFNGVDVFAFDLLTDELFAPDKEGYHNNRERIKRWVANVFEVPKR